MVVKGLSKDCLIDMDPLQKWPAMCEAIKLMKEACNGNDDSNVDKENAVSRLEKCENADVKANDNKKKRKRRKIKISNVNNNESNDKAVNSGKMLIGHNDNATRVIATLVHV